MLKYINRYINARILAEQCKNDKILYGVFAEEIDKKTIEMMDNLLYKKYNIVYNRKITFH